MYLGDLLQTKQVRAKCHVVFLSHPWNKPAQPPGKTDSHPLAKRKKLNEQWN
jgi:hypothetical protein